MLRNCAPRPRGRPGSSRSRAGCAARPPRPGASNRSPRPPHRGNARALRYSAIVVQVLILPVRRPGRADAASAAHDLRHPQARDCRRTVPAHRCRRARRRRPRSETALSATAPRLLWLSLAVTLALSACGDKDTPDTAAAPPAETAPAFTLDEASLPTVNRFQFADLDDSRNACVDFAGYANSKFLAANPVPGDRTSWGAFEMLDERSTAIQRQLAEHAAGIDNATGVEKLVGDFWATGMDEAKINAQGIEPLKDELAAIDALSDSAGIVQWLQQTAARGQGFLIGVGAMPDFQDSSINIAATGQGGLGL